MRQATPEQIVAFLTGGKMSYDPHLSDITELQKLRTEIERLNTTLSNALIVLNTTRIIIKNRDQRPDEMKLLDAVKIVIAEIEASRALHQRGG
jgi:hypothetical protein